MRLLELGKPVRRALAPGESHSFQIAAEAGQYVQIVVRPHGVNLIASLSAADGTRLLEIQRPEDSQWPEELSAIAASAGLLQVVVRAVDRDAPADTYEIELDELRPSVESDCERVEARRIMIEAWRLHAEGGKDPFRKAIGKEEEALGILRTVDDPHLEALVLDDMGELYQYLGEARKGLACHRRALEIRRSIGDQLGEAYTLNNIGSAHHFLSEMPEALNAHALALGLARLIGDQNSEANSLHNSGAIYNELGDIRNALGFQNEALKVVRAIGNRALLAATLNSIALIQRKSGDLQKALDTLDEVLALIRVLGERRHEPTVLSSIGFIYAELGQSDQALNFYRQALPLERAVGNRRSEAYTLSDIGDVYAESGNSESALPYYQEALKADRALSDRVGELGMLTRIGRLFFDRGDLRQSMEYHEQALALARNLGNRQAEALALTDIGAGLAAQRDPEGARRSLDQALGLAAAVGDKNQHARMLWYIAGIERDSGRYSEASAHLEQALQILESVRAALVSRSLRASYFRSRQKYYELAVDVLARRHREEPAAGFDRMALQMSERARARGLLELLAEAHADIREGLDPALRDREQRFRAELTTKLDAQTRLLARKASLEQVAAAAKQVDDLIGEYEQIQTQIRTSSPRYAALTQPRPVAADEIQREILDDQTLLLEYMLGDERSFLWALTPDTVSVFELPKRAEIESAAREFRDWCSRRGPKDIRRWEEGQQSARRLSKLVLGPVADLLGSKRLAVVADGALQLIPFGALATPGTDVPLLIDHEIVNLPSASSLAALRRELAERRPATRTLAVLADPVFERDDQRVRRSGAMGNLSMSRSTAGAGGAAWQSELARSVRDMDAGNANQIPRLPFTRQEAKAILNLVSPDDRKEALDFDASRPTAVSPELARYRFVHFATHGFLNTVHPELSGIVLSLVDRRGEPQAGFLSAADVFNLHLPADLVVLSGCQTALGKEVRGEGLVGLTRAFFYAGAARVVASLWRVDDVATATLMKRFYEGMLGKEHLPPAAALRAAQLSLWKEPQWRWPYYWAAFVLQGEWR